MAHVLFRALTALCFFGGAWLFCAGGSWPYAILLTLVGIGLWIGSGKTGSQ